jgi:hypothetical protein
LREGVEFRTVEHGGRTLVAVANYTDETVPVAIEHGDSRVEGARELLAAERRSLPARLGKRTAALFAL